MSTQFGFMNTLRREKRLVVVYLLGGTRLQGRIISFDRHGVLLETKTGMVLCSQDQISTIGPDVPRSMLKPRGARLQQQAPESGSKAPDGAAARRSHRNEARHEDTSASVMESRDALREPVLDPDAPPHTTPPQSVAVVVTQKPRRKIVLPEQAHSGT